MFWSYDPFGDDRMIYIVKNIALENQDIVYNDGIKKVILYNKGWFKGTERTSYLHGKHRTFQRSGQRSVGVS